MKIKISTVTPVHVGSGAEYSSAEFYRASYKGEKVLVRADINQLFALLSDDLKDEFVIQLEEPDFKLHSFLNQIKTQPPTDGLGKIRLYFSYLKGKLPDNVQEHIKTSNLAYIPGTSLKGSIKTAILYDMVENKDITRLHRLFHKGKNRKFEIKKWKSQNFVDEFFSSDQNNKPNTSIMRFLQVTDTSPIDRMSVYSVNSVKASSTGWTWYRHSIEHGRTFIETIGENQKMSFEINFNQTDELIQKLSLEDIEDYLSLERIKECIYLFSQDLIENEIEFSQKYNIDFLERFYENLSSQNTQKNPVMNIGQGTGFLASTIGLKIRELDKGLYDKVRQASGRKTYPQEFPKTRKVILENKVPLGWVRLV